MRYGVTKEEYKKCQPQIQRNDRIMLGIFSGMMALLFCVLILIEKNSSYTMPRTIMGIVAALICALIWFRGEGSSFFTRFALYVIFAMTLATAGYQGAFLNTEMYCTSFILVLAAFPVFLLDRPAPLFGISILAANIYLYCAWQMKSPEAAYGDTCNVIIALFWGMIAHYALGAIRVKGMLDRVELRNRDERHTELIGNTPVGICMMQLNDKNEFHLSYCSPGFLEMCRLSQEEADRLYQGSAYEGVHPEDRTWVQAEIERHTDEKSFILKDFRLVTGDGDYIWVSVVLRRRSLKVDYKSYYVVCTDITYEHLLRTQLYDSQKRFEVALENSDLQVWEYDLVNNRCINSKKAGKIYGASRVMENFPECLAEEGKADEKAMAIYLDMKKRLLNGEEKVSAEVRLVDASGNWHWRRIDYQLEKDSNGKPIRAIGCSREITEQKELQQKYNDQLAYRNSIAKNSLFCMRIDLDDDIIFEYTATEPRLKECVTEHMPATTLLTIFEGNAAEEMEEDSAHRCLDLKSLQNAYENGETQLHACYKCKLLRIYVDLDVSILKNPANGHREAFFVFTDVNDICMTQKAFGAVVNTNFVFVGIADILTGNFFCLVHSDRDYASAQYYDNYIETVHRFADVDREKFLTDEDYRMAYEEVSFENVTAHLKEMPLYEFNIRVRGKDTEINTYRLSYCYVDAKKNQILIVQTNVTKAVADAERDQQNLADALQAAEQASRAKSEFLSRMSHEIRTPMNAIIGISTLAVNDVKDPVLMSEDLSKIIMSARYLLSLINDILDMSRIESGRMALNAAPIEFDEFISGINNIIYSQCASKGIDYDVIVNGFLESTYVGDRVKLQQILVNILGNSVKFTPKGGKITLMIEQIRQEADQAALRFTISDTGIGMDEDFLPHLFAPFEQENSGITTAYGGTGLGLAISKNMVEMMDGHIDVHSIKGVGTEFVAEVKLGISDTSTRTAQLQLPKLRTLVVDDDVLVCQNAQIILEKIGLESEFTVSGISAIEMVKLNHEAAKDYDLILLDWKMPGMDGIETAREIRKIVGDDVTIIIMTAYDWSQIEKAARAAGVNMFMQKPIFQSTLLSAFEKIYGDVLEEAVPEKQEYHLEGRHILLVEDHPLNIEIAKRMLKSKGITVAEARNGLEAIECFSAAPAGTFDAILMDVRMPVMDGLTAAAHIRRLQKEGSRTIPIIAMTANAFEEDMKKSRESGMDAHLAKPIEPDLLFGTLERFINDKS